MLNQNSILIRIANKSRLFITIVIITMYED